MVIFGAKTVALFDVWSIEHFIAGMSVFAVARLVARRILPQDTKMTFGACGVYVLCLSYIWEVLEFYMEAGYTNIDVVTYWFQGIELWTNRIITDPLLVFLGSYVAFRFPIVIWFSRIFSVSWLGVHIFIFPHCMYLQELVVAWIKTL